MKKVVLISCLLGFMVFMQAQERDSEPPEVMIQPKEPAPIDYYPNAGVPVWEDEVKAYVASRVEYPEKAADKGLEGRVLIRFTVEADGNLSNFEILRDGIGYGAAESIVKILKKLQHLEPAQLNGEPIRSYYYFPVHFNLP